LNKQAEQVELAFPDQNKSVEFDYDLNISKMKKRIEKQNSKANKRLVNEQRLNAIIKN
jgi:hypothetical protein